jgi:hypothetical protein
VNSGLARVSKQDHLAQLAQRGATAQEVDMTRLDPLEQTQENLHPVIVAHRAREAASPAQAARGRLGYATIAMLLSGGALLAWLLLPLRG